MAKNCVSPSVLLIFQAASASGEFFGDIADAVQRADSEEFVVECVGILGNLTFSDLDFERLLKEYDLVSLLITYLLNSCSCSTAVEHAPYYL